MENKKESLSMHPYIHTSMHQKVLLINSVCGIGSTGRICTDLAQQFEKQGNEVKIAYGRNFYVPKQFQKYAVRIGNNLDVKLHALQSRLFDNHGFGSYNATKKFLNWVEEYNPNLIWLHNIHGYYINIELLFNWLKQHQNIQIKWTLHDCWAFTGHCSYFTFAKCNKWQTQCQNCPQKKMYPASLFKDNSKQNFEKKKQLFTGLKNITLITPSQWLANLVKQSFLKEYSVEVIYNTIDKNIFKPTPSDFRKKYGLENKKIILGVASVWDYRKGLNDFMELSKMLSDNYKIVLVGLTQKQIKFLHKNILGLQKTNSPQELAQIYSASDVFFNPTYEDNYPTVNLEAQACGTSVITYDVGGCKETLVNKQSYCIEVGDYKRFIDILKNKLCYK